MQQPEGFQQFGVDDEILVWKLNKSLYGWKQSGRNWNSLLHKLFEKHNFIQSCVYIRDDDNKILIVGRCCLVIAASSIKLMNEAK